MISALSFTSTAPSPLALPPSTSMVMQNGHMVATVCAPVSASSFARTRLMRSPMVSSSHMRPPPAPQQKPFLPSRGTDTSLCPAATSASRGASMMPL